MQSRRGILPLLIFSCVMGVFFYGLKKDPHDLPSALVNHKIPSFLLQDLSGNTVNEQVFANKVAIVNVWASWCYSCLKEHGELFKLAHNDKFLLIGLNYKDHAEDALDWLRQLRDPYYKIIADPEGKLALDLGVYGVPETFVLDHNGIIRLRISGAITQQIVQEKIAPLLQELA